MNKEIFDLKKMVTNATSPFSGKIEIHYSTVDRLDKIHAERMRKFGFIVLFSYPFGAHEVVRSLRDNGSIGDIFLEVFEK